jgi:hypothetical protein
MALTHAIKPRFGLAKFLRFGKITARSVFETPNQDPIVAAYWSTEVVGIWLLPD